MPGDEVILFGNARINRDPLVYDPVPDDSLIVKPRKSSLLRLNYFDLFFLSNLGNFDLISRSLKAGRRGWAGIALAIGLTAWMGIV